MNRKKKIIFIADELDPAGISQLKKQFKVLSAIGLRNDELLQKIISVSATENVAGLIVRSVRNINSVFLRSLKKFTNIKIICTVSAGYDNIDTVTAKKNGIDVINVPGGNNISAGEFTIALILSVSKGIISADSKMKKGKFENSRIANFELYGKTLGIVGVGRVGSYTAKLAKAFGMNIIGNDIKKELADKYKYIKFVSLNKLLLLSDIITIHTPLDRTTQNLLNSKNIKLLKKNAVLINCSRGGIVDELALIKQLKTDRLRYAAVDVFRNEPGFEKKFCKLPNVILTPHLAGKTKESKQRMSLIAAKNMIKYFKNGRSSVKLVN